MEKKELKTFFSKFWKVQESKINDDLKIDDAAIPNFNSMRFYQFIAAVEDNFGVSIKNVSAVKTFKNLLEEVE